MNILLISILALSLIPSLALPQAVEKAANINELSAKIWDWVAPSIPSCETLINSTAATVHSSRPRPRAFGPFEDFITRGILEVRREFYSAVALPNSALRDYERDWHFATISFDIAPVGIVEKRSSLFGSWAEGGLSYKDKPERFDTYDWFGNRLTVQTAVEMLVRYGYTNLPVGYQIVKPAKDSVPGIEQVRHIFYYPNAKPSYGIAIRDRDLGVYPFGPPEEQRVASFGKCNGEEGISLD